MALTAVNKSQEHASTGVRTYGEHALQEALADADFVVLALPATKENGKHV